MRNQIVYSYHERKYAAVCFRNKITALSKYWQFARDLLQLLQFGEENALLQMVWVAMF